MYFTRNFGDFPLTGFINKEVAFFANGFQFIFTRIDEEEQKALEPESLQLPVGVDGKFGITITPDESGYIYGITHSGRMIAIYVRKPFKVNPVKRINTWNYILYKGPEKRQFKAIRFIDGAIKSVKTCHALKKCFRKEKKLSKNGKNYIVYKVLDDTKAFTYDIKKADNSESADSTTDDTVSWTFASTVNQEFSIDNGDKLRNDSSHLTIGFETSQDLSTLYEYFGYVTTLLSFLTFRRIVPFDRIELLDSVYEGIYTTVAECFVSLDALFRGSFKTKVEDEPNRSNHNSLCRSNLNVISVHLLDDDVFHNLLSSIIQPDKPKEAASKRKKGKAVCVGLPIGVIPRDNDDVGKITSVLIREMCSALEVELDAAGVIASRSTEWDKLINDVKAVIKKHRNGDRPLEAKAYDVMYGSIQNWGDSLSDRAINAWNEHLDVLEPFLKMMHIWDREADACSITEEDIVDVIKVRNKITHRAEQNLNEEIAATTYALIALVYSMALRRIGLSKECVKELLLSELVG